MYQVFIPSAASDSWTSFLHTFYYRFHPNRTYVTQKRAYGIDKVSECLQERGVPHYSRHPLLTLNGVPQVLRAFHEQLAIPPFMNTAPDAIQTQGDAGAIMFTASRPHHPGGERNHLMAIHTMGR